ncbi:MAG: hypothetical protein Q9M43_08870 [Sulfurimonas sp.]|nr:hypothetical protein [Sulfurimonas sp.]
MSKLLSFLFISVSLLAQNNVAVDDIQLQEIKIKQERLKEELRISKIDKALLKLDAIEEKIAKEKVWMKSYASYMTSLDIRARIDKIKKRITFLEKKR